jgi:hypothetical protein
MLMEAGRAGVLGIRPPRCGERRAQGVLRCILVLVAVILCASTFVATARAENLPPPVSGGTAQLSASIPTNRAFGAARDGTGAPTDACAALRDATGTSASSGAGSPDTSDDSDVQGSDTTNEVASAARDSSASNVTSGAVTSRSMTDDSASATDASATATSDTSPTRIGNSATPTDTSDPSATAEVARDPSDTAEVTSDPFATATDTLDSSPTTTGPPAAAMGTASIATDTTVPTPSAGASLDTSGSSHLASDSTADAANASTDSRARAAPPPGNSGPDIPTATANSSMAPVSSARSPAPAGSQLSAGSATSPVEMGAPSFGSSASSFPTETPSDSIASDCPYGDAALVQLARTFGPAPEIGAIGVNSWGVDCGLTVVCGLAPLARTPSDFEWGLVSQCPRCLGDIKTPPQAGQLTARTSGDSDLRHGGKRPGSSRLPAPGHQLPVPIPYGSAPGSGSFEGSHGGAVLGVVAALPSLTPLNGSRLFTLVERRWRALRLLLSLERPG